MKKSSKLTVLALSLFAMGLTSCGEPSSPEPVPYEPETTVKEATVYMGLFETKEYTPDSSLSFHVTIDNSSIVTYENGVFQTGLQEGKTLAVFASTEWTYNVTVVVAKDATVPFFTIENSDISVYRGATYEFDTSLSYRSIDVNGYEHEIKVTKEGEGNVADIAVKGTSLQIKGKEIGTQAFTIYTEFAGFTLSKSLRVSVKDNNGLVVCGRNMIYDNLGPHYTISMYQYSANPINLENDIVVLKGGVEVPFSQLNIAFDDPSVLSLNGKMLAPHKMGKTFFTISTGGENIVVNVEIIKPTLNHIDFDLLDNRFDLDMSVHSTNSSRVYTPSPTATKTFKLPVQGAYTEVEKIVVAGKDIPFDASKVTYNSTTKEVTLPASIFTIANYGKQSVTLSLSAAEYLDTYTFSMDFVTKYISTYAQMSEYFVQKYAKDVIYGQYILKNDLDAKGANATAQYASLGTVNYAYGFRGIFDGDGHAIKNYRSTMFGFFLVVGEGAVIRNLTLDNVHYHVKVDDKNDNRGEMILGRFISGATLDNITVNLASDSITSDSRASGGKLDSSGLFCTEVFTFNTVRNMTIHAEGFELASIFGKQIPNSTFFNVNIYCKSLAFIGSDQSQLDGVTIHQA